MVSASIRGNPVNLVDRVERVKLKKYKVNQMESIDIIGHIGSAISSITFMPQVYQAWKTKRVEDLNLAMLVIVFVSTIVWLVYGVGKVLWPVIICNGIICLLSLLLIYFKFSFTKK
jgi:MtN3 and saliva related transmembrane protein